MTEEEGENLIDEETPIEETPGYLGHIFDDYVSFGPKLEALSDFDWAQFESMATDLDKCDRCLTLKLNGKTTVFSADASRINEFLDELPSVDAIYYCPPDQGPAGGAGYIFVAAEDYVEEHAKELRKALEVDYEILREEYVNDPELRKYYEDRDWELPKPLYK
tara:strand:- start:548 stop:1036 length:489 start_codon:yes stop_codon:yes gene_type:complete